MDVFFGCQIGPKMFVPPGMILDPSWRPETTWPCFLGWTDIGCSFRHRSVPGRLCLGEEEFGGRPSWGTVNWFNSMPLWNAGANGTNQIQPFSFEFQTCAVQHVQVKLHNIHESICSTVAAFFPTQRFDISVKERKSPTTWSLERRGQVLGHLEFSRSWAQRVLLGDSLEV